MKRALLIVGALLVVAPFGRAQAPGNYPLTVNSKAETLPSVTVYRSAPRTFALSFKDGTTASDISGQTPWMSWSTNANAATVNTAACATVSATGGTATATFSASDFNYASGRYFYQVGVSTGGTASVYRDGVLIIRGSPFTTPGIAAVVWGTNLNWATVSQYVGTADSGPVRAGTSIVATVNGDGSVDHNVTAFTGASTTGTVTSAAGDTAKFLRGDGTWQVVAGSGDLTSVTSQTPAYVYIVGGDSGDVGVGVSNVASAAQGTLADTALQPADTSGWVVVSHGDATWTNAVRAAQTNDGTGTDTTFTNWLGVSGWLSLTGAARSGSNTVNTVANSAFTNAVQAAQTNIVEVDPAWVAASNTTRIATTNDAVTEANSVAAATYLPLAGGTMAGDIGLGGNNISDVGGTIILNLANSYFKGAGWTFSNGVTVAGAALTMSGQNIDLGGNIATNYGTPTAADHVIDKGYADTRYVYVSGDTITGDLILDDGVVDSPLLQLNAAVGTMTFLMKNAGDFCLDMRGSAEGGFNIYGADAGDIYILAQVTNNEVAFQIDTEEGTKVTVDGDGDVVATSFSGDGSALTAIPAAQLTGNAPIAVLTNALANPGATLAIASDGSAVTFGGDLDMGGNTASNGTFSGTHTGDGAGVTNIAYIRGTAITNTAAAPTDNYILKYDAALGLWNYEEDTGGGGGTVTQWWDSVHAEGVGLAVGPAQPSSYITNLVYGSVTQQLEYLAFDDTTEEYTGAQTKVWPHTNTTLYVRGATWYTDATPDADWSLWYVVDGATASEIVLNPTVAAAGVTNLDTWVVSTNWTGVSQGDAVKYWISRDVGGDAGTGDNYLRNIELYGVNQ